MKIKYAQGARVEFASATRRYARVAGTACANAFRTEVRHMEMLITAHPDMGAQTVNRCRYMVLDRFPFSVVYRHVTDTLIIIAIAHHSRRPGYWAGRR